MPPKSESPTTPNDEEQQLPSNKTDAIREEGVSDENWKTFCETKKGQALNSKMRMIRAERLKQDIQSFEEKQDEAKVKKCRDQLTKVQGDMNYKQKVQNALQAMGRCEAGYC